MLSSAAVNNGQWQGESNGLLKGGALLKELINKVKASVGKREIWTVVVVVLDTGARSNLMKESCLSKAYARRVITMKTTCLRSVPSLQRKVERLTRLEVHFWQSVAETSFLLVTNLATHTILEKLILRKILRKLSSLKLHWALQVGALLQKSNV